MQLFQWGVIILFVLLHFALGYFRGAAKSGYFTLVNIILSFIILWIVSGVSVANSLPQADLIAQIEANLSGSVSAELLAYLTRTEVITLLYGLVDVFVRIATFLVLYTVVRWFISFVGFGLLYKYVLEKHVQKVFKVEKVTFTTEKDKENDGAETIKDPVIHAKVIKKSTDRLIGGAFGAVRGFITAIFLLLPLVVLASTTNNLNFEDGGDVFGEADAYELIEPLQVTPVFAGLQNGLFDWAFETELTETQNFNLRDELNVVTAIVQRAYEAGYLSEDFDVNTLGSADVAAVQDILGLVGDSGVLISFLDVGSDLAADGLLEELTGLELSDGAATQAALAELADIDWKLELAALGIIFEKVVAVGDLEDVLALTEDTQAIADLTNAQATALADVLRALADLQLIKVANVGLEYVLELEDVQANIEWLPVAEREAYLKEALAEVLNDTEFFYGENGDLYNIADLLEVVLSQYGTFSVAQLLEEDALDALLTEDGEDFLNATLDEVTQVEIVSALLPTAVDFALYSAFDADVAAELDEALNDTLADLDFDAEFDTFGQIFGALVTLTANELLAGNEDVIAFVDRVAQNNLPTVRLLVGYVFDDSVLVNAALNEAAPVLLDAFVEDQDTKDLLDTLLFDENGLTINLGQELNTLLDVLEVTYGFTTLEGLLGATEGLDLRGSAELGYAFGSLTPAQFNSLTTAIKELQLLELLDKENTESLLTFLGLENVYVPEDFDAALEVEFLLNLVYGLSVYLHENMEPGLTPIEDVDFTELLLSDALAGLLLVQEGTLNSQLLVPNLAYSIESALIEAGLDETIIVPEVLLASNPESAAWAAEYNVLVTLLLTVAELAADYYELSFWGLEDALASTGGELVDTLALVDGILGPNVGTLKLVVGGIVANSQILVATADHTLNTLVEPILGTEVSINVIQEILTLLDVVEVGYKFTSLEGLYTISQDLSLDNLAAAGNAFGSLSAADATTVVQRLTSLQLVQALDRSLMLEALNNLGAANVVVPQDFNAAYELGVVLNLVYATSHYLHEETNEVLGVKGLDFGPLLTSAAFENFMVAEEGNTYSKLLVANFKQLMLMLEDMPALRLYFDVPTSLEVQFASSAAWTAEYNRLVKFVIAIAGALNENIELSSNKVTEFTNSSFRTLPLDVIDPFNDPVVFNQTFGVLDDSEIFRASALKLFELGQLVSENVYGYELELPLNVIENGALKNNALQALFRPLVSILVDVKDASGLNIVRDLLLQRTAEETLEFLGLLKAINRDDVILLGQSEILNGILSNFLTNSNNQDLFSTTLLELAANYAGIQSDLISNIPFSSDFFTINPSALDRNGNLTSNEIVIMFDLANAVTTTTGLFEFNTLDNIYANGLLESLFDSNILMSYASNAIQNEALQAYLIEVANDRQDIATVPSTFVELDAALLDANGFVLVSELEALADVMYVLGFMDIDTVRQMMADLVESPSITTALGLLRGYAVTDDFENQRIDTILSSNIVYTVIGQYLDNENLDDVLLPFLPEALVDLFGNVDLGVPRDLKADEGFSVDYISRAELKALLTAVTYIPVDPTALDENVFNFITDLIGENVNADTNQDDLDRFLASGYLREKLSRLFLSEAVLDLFGETPESFTLPTSSYVVVDQQRRLTAVELRNLVEAFAVLEITTIDELNFSFSAFTALTPAERETVLASAYLYAVVDGLVQNQQSVAIPQNILSVTGDISQAELLAVIEAVAFLQITDVTNLEAAIITLVNGNDLESLNQLNALRAIDSTIVNDLIDSLTP